MEKKNMIDEVESCTAGRFLSGNSQRVSGKEAAVKIVNPY